MPDDEKRPKTLYRIMVGLILCAAVVCVFVSESGGIDRSKWDANPRDQYTNYRFWTKSGGFNGPPPKSEHEADSSKTKKLHAGESAKTTSTSTTTTTTTTTTPSTTTTSTTTTTTTPSTSSTTPTGTSTMSTTSSITTTPGPPTATAASTTTAEPLINAELQAELERRLDNATDMKFILVWRPMFGSKPSVPINPTECGTCQVTYDHGTIDDERTMAVIIHFDDIRDATVPPLANRNPKQLYIYWDLESTATVRNTRGRSLDYEEKFGFNATMTYRKDSDFYNSYESVLIADIVANNKQSLEDIVKSKTKTAIAVVSNCGYTAGARRRIVMLRDYIKLGLKLEGFGNCFRENGKIANGKPRQSPDFYKDVEKYRFYFSYENSYHCKEYITEKFFNNALVAKTVPVVWGAKREDYEAVAPPGSFIFAEDFASNKELVEYLQYLEKNDTAYMEYLRWLEMKPSDMPQYGRARTYCAICRTLHGINVDDVYNPKYDASNPKRPLFTDGMAPRTLSSLKGWFYGEDNPECFSS